MLNVLNVVRRVFWNDNMYDWSLLPPEANVEKCQATLADLATMTGAGRIEVFEECGIHSALHPVFLRALQHLTATHGSGSIVDNYTIHHHLSAQSWSPFVTVSPLLGYSTVISNAFSTENTEVCSFRLRGEKVLNSNSADTKMSHNGLLNQGATCYLNSLLQALFHISEFRWTIYQMPTQEEAEEKNVVGVKQTKSIPYALQRLFCLLQTGNKAVDTTELTESFGWSSTDGFIQHDVHELTCELLDNLENKLKCVQDSDKKDSSEHTRNNAISRLFVGVLENFVRVDEVGYYGTREELFSDLQLVVKNTTDIYTSFDRLFQVEILDGKNKYCLELDGKKSYYRAEKGMRLKITPPIMLLHLARFDYDMQRGETKVLSRWDYYSSLDLSTYMPHASKDDTHYTLCSVLVHSGSDTRFGHYFCFTKCSGTWYRFNDEVASPASLQEVFGANFGGFRVNYWGSEVPNTTNAYMLVYVRTSEMGHLLRPIGSEDVPLHVIEQLEREQKEYERLLREQAEDHLYGRVYFIQPEDIAGNHELLFSRRPRDWHFTGQKTLRVLLTAEALPEFELFVEKQLGIPSCEQQLWFCSARDEGDGVCLHKQVSKGLTVLDILHTEKECCVLVVNSSNAHHVQVDGDDVLRFYIFHHKLYIPLQLKVVFLGCTVLSHSRSVSSAEAIELMKPFVQKRIVELPKDPNLKRNHHLITASSKCIADLEMVAADSMGSLLGGLAFSSEELEKKAERELSVLCEDEYSRFSKCSRSLRSGDVLVWQESVTEEDQSNVFYPDIVSFQHFLRSRISVEIKLNFPTLYPTLIDTQLAADMTYEQLQRYVARLIGHPKGYDHIRFATHSPETKQPYFLKAKKRDCPTLVKLLSPLLQHRATISRYLYYEYCKYTVTEIEAAHSLQFKLFSESVKPLSEHWVLMPRDIPIMPREVFSACVKEIQQVRSTSIASCSRTSLGMKNENEKEGQQGDVLDPDIMFYNNLVSHEAWKVLRLVDVWRGRIYNVFDKDHPQTFERSTFEESAEYRIERIPSPIGDIPLKSQSLVQVYHFTMTRNGSNPIETHGYPFSIYIGHDELAPSLLHRIANKLGLTETAVMDWKMALVKGSSVVEVLPGVPMGKQLLEFCHEHHYQPNGKCPLGTAFLGLEHAPLSKRSLRKEGKVVIFN